MEVMNAEIIKVVGEYIIIPICIAVGVVAFFWSMK